MNTTRQYWVGFEEKTLTTLIFFADISRHMVIFTDWREACFLFGWNSSCPSNFFRTQPLIASSNQASQNVWHCTFFHKIWWRRCRNVWHRNVSHRKWDFFFASRICRSERFLNQRCEQAKPLVENFTEFCSDSGCLWPNTGEMDGVWPVFFSSNRGRVTCLIRPEIIPKISPMLLVLWGTQKSTQNIPKMLPGPSILTQVTGARKSLCDILGKSKLGQGKIDSEWVVPRKKLE